MSGGSAIHLGIDAVNIRQGGGVTHLSQLLGAAEPASAGIGRVTIWSAASMARAWPERPWLTQRSAAWMEGSLPRRIIGQQFELPAALAAERCDVLFAPGGTLPWHSPVPALTMSQNLLPFEPREAATFGPFNVMRMKLGLLRRAQSRSFRRADGVVFLTNYAQRTVERALGRLPGEVARIAHGIEPRFLQAPREQRPASAFDVENPFRVLYVSILMPYKHQVEVARAASRLRSAGSPIELRFVGAPWGQYGERFRALIEELDPRHEYLVWRGAEAFTEVHELYRRANAFVFASSCENLPNILIEAMAAGLPIACSRRGPMPEVLGDAGLYFEPDDPADIAAAIERLMQNAALRAELAAAAWRQAQSYSWRRCADETLRFVARVARSCRPGATLLAVDS